jgi:hypothetical protein
MRTDTSFDADQAWSHRQIELLALRTLLWQHDLSTAIKPDDVKRFFPIFDADYGDS